MWNWILQNGMTVLGLGGYAILGILGLLGYFRQDDTRRKESDEIADTLISRLQSRVEQLEEDMVAHTKQRDEELGKLRSQVDHLSGRNGMLEDLFKGRDPGMQTFLKEAPVLMTIAKENNGIAKEMAQGIGKLESTLVRFIDTLQPILVHMDMQQTPAEEI